MSDFSKSGNGTSHGNTAVLQKVKIYFQVFPGVLGSDKQRGIAGVPYEVEIGDPQGVRLISEGKTAQDGGIELIIPSGDTAFLTIFETEYVITVRNSLPSVTSAVGLQRRLGFLGYYTGNGQSTSDQETVVALLNYQADCNFNAIGERNPPTENQLVKDFGE